MSKQQPRSPNDPAKSLVETLRSSELAPLSGELAEAALDGILEDGVLKDLPVVGSLIALYKTGQSVRDHLFTKKLMTFLGGVQQLSKQERAVVLGKVAANPEAAGELLLLALERMDSMEKPALLAKTFCLLADGHITAAEFHSLRRVIDVVHLDDLPEITDFYNYYTYCPDELISSLLQTKLATVSKGGIMDHAHPLYTTTAIGKLFLTKVMGIALDPELFKPKAEA